MAATREVSPLLQKIRTFLLGRERSNALRFADYVAPRTQPPPELPEGVHHKLAANYYYTRDARREVVPPNVLADNSRKAIAASTEKGVAAASKPPVPGTLWKWD